MTARADPRALVRSRSYVGLLLVAALLGAPISAAAYGFLALVGYLQRELFVHLPAELGFAAAPAWWPLPLLAVAGLLVAWVIRYLPGTGGHSPADGFKAGGTPAPIELPGVVAAALLTLCLGAVLGPEAPLIALGGGLAVLAGRLLRRDMPAPAMAVVAAAGSFASVSTLLGSPILGAFLLMEASGLGGAMLSLTLLPGLLAAGIGALVFVGLNSWTGLGTFSLSIPNLPPYTHPSLAEFGWALAIGLAAALVGTAVRRFALLIRPHVEKRSFVLTPLLGIVIAGLAIGYAQTTGKSSSDVLFSGQTALGPLITNASGYSVGAIVLLLVCKGLAYSLSLSGFRGGPVFPSLFLGAAGGVALSHLPGMSLVGGVAMGMGALCASMLMLPLTSVMLATLLLLSDGAAVMPLVIVATVVAYVVTSRLTPRPAATAGATQRDDEP
ncbi:chloride channel protein [Amycolatopsis sp. RM579]|uniref:Chloride channel protein n=1 Tax=Amycolatopsis pithecellobii TaxID=664692 RepID=A0A6N7ZCN3_9PSEU|nr:chloride channel protein [Amycolatopsis pithecellobii]